MCTQDCRTWLWGGGGNPTYDDGGGRCSCACDDERWSDHNLLGRASCVPVLAHAIFGWVGVALSAAALCHAAYHLHMQVKFHAQDLVASTLPAERCRRQLHPLVITVSLICLCFFSMVLGDKLRWSGVLVSAIQIPSNVGGVLAIRIWIYTTTPGLMNRSPEMVSFSAWLETPAGRRIAWVAVSVVPFAAIILAVADHPEDAMKTTTAGILLVTSFIAGSFWMCGRPLIRFIDESIENRKARGHAKDGDDEDRALLAARNKVTWTLSFAARQMTVMGSTLMFAIFSKYGTAAPLLLFDTPMVVITLIKMMVSVQLFAGRTKLSAPQGLRYRTGVKLRGSHSSQTCSIMKSIFRNGKVVPIEEATCLEQTAVDQTQRIRSGSV